MISIEQQDVLTDLSRDWYRLMDAKASLEILSEYISEQRFVVEFPNNNMDYEKFCAWYDSQRLNYSGKHIIHNIKICGDDEEAEVFMEITWEAVTSDGQTISLFPNVTLRFHPVHNKWRIFYYGCIDRQLNGGC